MHVLLLLTTLTSPALAQDDEAPEPPEAERTVTAERGETSDDASEAAPPADAEGPEVLAVPAQSPPPVAAPSRPLAIPGDLRDPEERAQAIRQYRMQYLAVRSWSEIRSSMVYSNVGYGYGGYGPYGPYGWGGVTIARPWLWQEQQWGVFRGPQRLDNLGYLNTVGRVDERADLERRIRKNRTVARTFYGIAIAGGAATVAGLVGMDNAAVGGTWSDWRTVQVAGLGAVFGGVVAGAFPSNRARRLQTDFTTIRDWDTLQDEILEHNDALREELELSAQDALKVESTR